MKFIGLSLILNLPDPITGRQQTATQCLHEAVDDAVLFEELGFDGHGVGERHHTPFLSSAPPVVLSDIAARTNRIRLFTGVTLLSILDPVRVAEGSVDLPAQYGDPIFSANVIAAKRSQDAYDVDRPVFEASLARKRQFGLEPVFLAFEDHLARSSALISSPELPRSTP